MTQTFATNEKNDIYIGEDGNLVINSGLDAVRGACETASYAILKEMVLSINSGLPYFETIFVGSPNYQIFRTYLINTLLGVNGVLSIQSLALTVQNGVLNYSATIVTQYGTTQLIATADLGANNG